MNAAVMLLLMRQGPAVTTGPILVPGAETKLSRENLHFALSRDRLHFEVEEE